MASGEDNDLAYRLHDNGGTLRFVSEARVAHYHPTRLWPYLRTQMRHGFWRMKLYAKHPRKSGGDQYAGIAEFAGPPLSLIILADLAALAIASTTAFFSVWMFLPLLLIPIHSGLQRNITRVIANRLGLLNGLKFQCMLFLRDVARAIGLVRGVWTFMILHKEAV